MLTSNSEFQPREILNFLDKHKDFLLLGVFGVLMLGIGIREWQRSTKPPEIVVEELEGGDGVIGDVLVDISGAVNNPGVYRFEIGSRVSQAIEAAQGFTDEADAEWIAQQLNLAQELQDGSKIYIPITQELTDNQQSDNISTNPNSGLININAASSSQLESLSGIGEVRAESIINNRPYTSINELTDKADIPSSVVEDIRDAITLY